MTAARVSAKKVDREGPIHKAVLAYLRMALPGAVIHHSPNETDMRGRQAMLMVTRAKALGMQVGFPDLLVIWQGAVWGFEVKAPGNYPTEAQRATGAALEAQGARWAVVQSVDDAAACVAAWMDDVPAAVLVPIKGVVS
jgi:hypothetical protein